MKEKIFIIIILITGMSANAAPAAYAANVPSDETAGAEEARFTKEQSFKTQSKVVRKEKPPAVINETTNDEKDKLKERGSYTRLNRVRFVGNEIIQTSELELFTQPYLHQDLQMEDILDLAIKIKDYYRRKGFISVYAYVPPQTIKEGVVEIRIAEGRLEQIHVEGNRWFSDKVISKQIILKKGEIIDYESLRSALVRINEYRDIEAKAVLKPGEEPKSTDIVLEIKDRFPVHAGLDVNNLGTKNTGSIRWGESLTFTNLSGRLDELSGRFQMGKGARAIGADYNLPIVFPDTRLGFSFTRATVNVGGDFKALDLEGNATTYGIYFLQRLFKIYGIQTSAKAGFDWKSVENRILGEVSGNDELRILNLDFNLDQSDRFGRTFNTHSFNFGFDRFLGASHKDDSRATRTGSGGQFFAYRLSLLRLLKLPYDSKLILRSSAQLTPDILAPSEQFRLGGAYSVRGFSEAEYLGDYGAQGSIEANVPTYFFPESWKLPRANKPLRHQIQAVAFLDFGGAGIRRPLPGEDKSRFLTGIGGGLRIHLYERVYARLEWGAPIVGTPNDRSRSAFYFGVSSELF